MNLPVLGLVAAYAAVACLLLSLNLTSLWRWWVKAAAIVVTIFLVGVTYQAINGLIGWPTTQRLPQRFALVAAQVAEPDRRSNNPGHIYLWANELDENNVPSNLPRSYQLPYSKALSGKISGAQEKLGQGIEVMGVLSDKEAQAGPDLKSEAKGGQAKKNDSQQSPANNGVPFQEDGSEISFEDLPPVVLPDKGPPS